MAYEDVIRALAQVDMHRDPFMMSPQEIRDTGYDQFPNPSQRAMGLDRLKKEMLLNYVSPGLRGMSAMDNMKMLELDRYVPRRKE